MHLAFRTVVGVIVEFGDALGGDGFRISLHRDPVRCRFLRQALGPDRIRARAALEEVQRSGVARAQSHGLNRRCGQPRAAPLQGAQGLSDRAALPRCFPAADAFLLILLDSLYFLLLFQHFL